MKSRVDEYIEHLIEEAQEIDEKNVNTEKLPEYGQKIIAEFLFKYYNFEVSLNNFGEVFKEFADKIRPHLAPPFLPTQQNPKREKQ